MPVGEIVAVARHASPSKGYASRNFAMTDADLFMNIAEHGSATCGAALVVPKSKHKPANAELASRAVRSGVLKSISP
jgi:hypothetical protein